ncbi:hypothetical protein BJX96DRAFT_3676 [Aspergillus floccosus]
MFLFLGRHMKEKTYHKKRTLFHRLRRRAPCMQKHYSSIYILLSSFSFLFEQCLSAESKTTPFFFIYKKTTMDDKKEYRCLVTTARETTYQHFAYCLAFVYGATALLFNVLSLLFFLFQSRPRGRFLSQFAETCRVDIRPRCTCPNISSYMHDFSDSPRRRGGLWQSCG